MAKNDNIEFSFIPQRIKCFFVVRQAVAFGLSLCCVLGLTLLFYLCYNKNAYIVFCDPLSNTLKGRLTETLYPLAFSFFVSDYCDYQPLNGQIRHFYLSTTILSFLAQKCVHGAISGQIRVS